MAVNWSVPSAAWHKRPVSAATIRAQGASLMHQGASVEEVMLYQKPGQKIQSVVRGLDLI